MNDLHFCTKGLEIEDALKRLSPFSFLQHVELFDVPNYCADDEVEPEILFEDPQRADREAACGAGLLEFPRLV